MYLNDLQNSGVNKDDIVLWVTGHSRGAAISNIVGSRAIDPNDILNMKRSNCYVYTFACPRTTTVDFDEANSYKYIFNILNDDDIIHRLPLQAWGFKHYGVDKNTSIEFDSQNKAVWEYKMGCDYISNAAKRVNLIADFCELANDRNDCYKIVYSDNYRVNLYSYYDDINKMKESESIKNGINYADYKISHKDSAGVYTIEKYESVAYFMQFLAQMAAEGEKCIITGGEYLLTDVPVAFEDIKSEFMHYADDMLGEDDITSPHLPIGYCIISNRA